MVRAVKRKSVEARRRKGRRGGVDRVLGMKIAGLPGPVIRHDTSPTRGSDSSVGRYSDGSEFRVLGCEYSARVGPLRCRYIPRTSHYVLNNNVQRSISNHHLPLPPAQTTSPTTNQASATGAAAHHLLPLLKEGSEARRTTPVGQEHQ